jgi:hypothetical protein
LHTQYDQTPSYSQISDDGSGTLSLIGTYNIGEPLPNNNGEPLYNLKWGTCIGDFLFFGSDEGGVYQYRFLQESAPEFIGPWISQASFNDYGYGPPDEDYIWVTGLTKLDDYLVITSSRSLFWYNTWVGDIEIDTALLETYSVSENGTLSLVYSCHAMDVGQGPFPVGDNGFLMIKWNNAFYSPLAENQESIYSRLPFSCYSSAFNNSTLASITEAGLAVFSFNDSTKTLDLTGQYSAPEWDEEYSIGMKQSVVFVAAGGEGLIALDVSNPGQISEIYRIDQFNDALSVAIRDNTLYLATSNGLYEFQITDPFSPILLGCLPQSGMTKAVAVQDDRLYSLSECGILRDYDISAPSAPVQFDVIDLSGGHYNDIVTQDTLVYALDSSTGLHVIDASESSNMQQIAELSLDVNRSFTCLGLGEDVLVTGGEGLLQIIDTSNPNNPILRGSSSSEISNWGRFSGLSVEGNIVIAVLSDYVFDNHYGKIKAYDISDRDIPVIIGGINFTYPIYGLSRLGQYVFTMEQEQEEQNLYIIDIGDILHPTLAAQYSLPDNGVPSNLSVNGNFLYICYGSGGLLVMNISNPLTPFLCGSYNSLGVAIRSAVNGNIAYLADEGFFGVYDCDDALNYCPVETFNQDAAPIYPTLAPNYPNPFNPTTSIAFSMPTSDTAQLAIYNLRGQKISTLVNGNIEAGCHTATWNGTDDKGCSVGSGVYFYRFSCGNQVLTRKMILLK